MYPVLVAEDEHWIRSAVVDMIEAMGNNFHIVAEAANGEEAWNLILEHWPMIVVTDIMMPRKDGLWLTKRIFEHHLPIICIVISGYDNFHYAQQAMRYHVTDYLLKPLKHAELRNVMDVSMDRLHRFTEHHEVLMSIQQFVEKLTEASDHSRLIRETKHLLQAIARTKTYHPGARHSLYLILANKIEDLLQSITPERERIRLLPEETSLVHAAILELIDQWMKEFCNRSHSDVKLVIRQCCDYIQQYYMKNLTLTDMAETAHMSVSGFTSHFKKSTGATFIQYLNKTRIDKAKELLAIPENKVG